jgi:hypothetical protein
MALGGDSRLTIELLFPDCYVERFLSRIPVAGDGIATRLAARKDTQKRDVAAAASNMPASAFVAFEPIFSLLRNISASG